MTPEALIHLAAVLVREAEELARRCAAEPNSHLAELHLVRARALYLELCGLASNRPECERHLLRRRARDGVEPHADQLDFAALADSTRAAETLASMVKK